MKLRRLNGLKLTHYHLMLIIEIGLFVIIPDGGGEALEHVGICKLLALAYKIQIDEICQCF